MKALAIVLTCLMALVCGFAGSAGALWLFHDQFSTPGPRGPAGAKGQQGPVGPEGPPDNALKDRQLNSLLTTMAQRIGDLQRQHDDGWTLSNFLCTGLDDPTLVTDVTTDAFGNLQVQKDTYCIKPAS